MAGRISGFALCCLLTSCCISENYTLCPDFGKYRVNFYLKDSIIHKDKMYMTLYYSQESSGEVIKGFERYEKEAYNMNPDSEKTFRLPPGHFRFCALLSSSPVVVQNDNYKMENRCLYFFGDTVERIIKKSENRVILRCAPVNAIIQAQCTLDPSLSAGYEIKDFSMSSPDDTGITINPENGKSGYSESITEFYDHFELENSGTIFQYCCVPFRGGCYINFRITLTNNALKVKANDGDVRVLKNRIFLKSNIEQGKIYRFSFDVTALEIRCKSTTVIDWDEYYSEREIPFI
jgi:hypothetical protein